MHVDQSQSLSSMLLIISQAAAIKRLMDSDSRQVCTQMESGGFYVEQSGWLSLSSAQYKMYLPLITSQEYKDDSLLDGLQGGNDYACWHGHQF